MRTSTPTLPRDNGVIRGARGGTLAALDGGTWLYRIGGVSAAVMAGLMIGHVGVFAAVGLPTTVAEWFDLFRRSALLGLLGFELLMVAYVLASIPLALALYAALRRTNPTLMALYLGLSLVGGVAFVAARPAFEMLALATGYAAAPVAEQARYLAAGEAMLAVFHGTSFWVSYGAGSVAGLLLGAALLRDGRLGAAPAYLRIASSVLDLGLFLPGIGLALSLLSVLCLLLFHVLVAARLPRVGGDAPADRTPRSPERHRPSTRRQRGIAWAR